MGELGGTTEYLYWSARRTSRFLEDNELVVRSITHTITSPSFTWLPTFSRSTTAHNDLRPQTARMIEKALGQLAVTRFNAPGPIAYAKGVSTVVFGEFVTFDVTPARKPAVLFTAADHDRKDRGSVAICMFGSLDNFLEYIQSAGPGYDGGPLGEGWVSSSAPAVYNFIRSHGQQIDRPLEPESLAIEALKIADSQGMYEPFQIAQIGIDDPWRRSFTYGDARKAEWLAQIYLDVDLEASGRGRRDGFRRVLIGAPLWIRTPRPHAVKIYALTDDPCMGFDLKRHLGQGS